LAIGLSVYDPDHPLHDHFMLIGTRGSELSHEGRRHLVELVDLATASATELAELEFSTVHELPGSCREVLSEARERVSEISWLLWGVSVALEFSEALGEPPGHPREILICCAATAADSYSTRSSREGSAVLPVEKNEE
jgi:hypothetical protein